MPAKGTLIADGAFTLHHGNTDTGVENWRLEKLAHGGLVFSSNAELARPKPLKWNYTFEINQHWAPVRFTIHLDLDGKSLASEQRADDAAWRVRVTPNGEEPKDSAVAFSNKHEVYFPSPLFNAVTLVRLNLLVGKSSDVETVVLNLFTLEPRPAKQNYACAAEEQVEVPAGKFSAWHYTVRTAREDGGAPTENSFWADRHGTVLRYASASGDEVKLARYRRIERREK